MVQVLVKPTLPQGSGPEGHEAGDAYHSQDAAMCREEHAQRMKEANTKRAMRRAPRRGWSLTDYQDDFHRAMPHYHPHHIPLVDRQTPIPENAVLQSIMSRPGSPSSSFMSMSMSMSSSASSTVGPLPRIPQRPRSKLPPPRRSHSVTDKEPEPSGQPRLAAHMNLLDLPSELHYALFDFLDPIDGACLGLAHSRLYSIHRRKNGTVPLCSRYSGPNDLEWAWRGAGPLVRKETPDLVPRPSDKPLDRLRVKGQVYCRKCGISRCELHRHLKDWMGSNYEYCEIRKVYGPRAGGSAKTYCYMSSPKHHHRCGRHGGSAHVSAKQ